jgi:hypothetical protein
MENEASSTLKRMLVNENGMIIAAEALTEAIHCKQPPAHLAETTGTCQISTTPTAPIPSPNNTNRGNFGTTSKGARTSEGEDSQH